ncbi:hypothetical protein [Nonomuraea jabiensis]|uniref:hypothetical protein n=1 Tax=Nonomuraea jabiensis TaxID=882448 RepID=UPI003D71B862
MVLFGETAKETLKVTQPYSGSEQGPQPFIGYLMRARAAAWNPSAEWLARHSKIPKATVETLIGGRRRRLPDWNEQVEPLLKALRRKVHVDERGDPDGVLGNMMAWKQAYDDAQNHRPLTCPLPDSSHTPPLAGSGSRLPGRPLEEVADPFEHQLEVHPAIDTGAAGVPVLPVYVPREHDRLLGEVVARAAAGSSGIAVLVGGSSTGKTRACWEALTLLRERDQPWRLWHPIDPTRPGAALTELSGIGPYTVVWLNEAQFYLAEQKTGEQVAAGLRELLRDPHRTPVLVLATLWPEHWITLTTRTDPDLHAQARELLDGHKIKVPEAFTGTDLATLAHYVGKDPRLGEAAEHAQGGQITQYLAGVPVLLDRYLEAPPAI